MVIRLCLLIACVSVVGAPAVALGVPSNLTQQGVLALPSPVASDEFGTSLAISGSGSTLAAGATGYDFAVANRGGVGLFSRTGSTWSFDQTLVSAGPATAGDDMGACVAVSGDGRVVATGIPADDIGGNANQGSVQVADAVNGASGAGAAALWAGATLLVDAAPNAAAGAEFGCPIALSSDGTTLAVGARGSNGATGHVSVFVRSGATYTRQAVLTRPGGATNDGFPSSMAIAANGSTLLTGTSGVGGFSGTATAFTRTGATWGSQWTLNGGGSGSLGAEVALSSDGSVGLVYRAGTAVIFDHAGSSWTERAVITPPAAEGDFVFQSSIERVAVSGDGRMAAVATPGSRPSSPIQVGRVHTYDISGATPVALQHLTPSGYAGSDQWGAGGVALSDDGTTLAVGAPSADAGALGSTGKVAVFAAPAAPPAPGGSPSVGATPGGTTSPSGGSPAVAAPARPAVKWAYTRTTRRLLGTVTPVTGVTYAMTATKGRTTRRGTCRRATITSGTGRRRTTKRVISCSMKVAAGTWVVRITPSAGGVKGAAAGRTVR